MNYYQIRNEHGGLKRDEVVATAPVFMRARLQMARLQDVIDYGMGDVERAARILGKIKSAHDHTAKHEWYQAAHGTPTCLKLALSDWHFAIDSVCWEIDAPQREAERAEHLADLRRDDAMVSEWEATNG